MERQSVKIGVIGGGSVFTPELIDLLAKSFQIMPIKELVLMDINEPRVKILQKISERLVKRAGVNFPVRITTSYRDAINQADFVLIQLRAGDQKGRITDEKIGLKYHIPFVETVSVCGLGTFLRSIKIYEEIAALIKECAPNAYVMNFANPAGPLTEYLMRLGITKTMGVCNVPVILAKSMSTMFQAPEEDFYMQTRGLNHLTVTDAVYLNGENILNDVLNRAVPDKFPFPFTEDVLHAFPAIFNPYVQYYWHGEKILEKLLHSSQTRGEEVVEIEKQLLALYDDPQTNTVPDLLTSRGGSGYSLVVAHLMLSFYRNDDVIHYINIRNSGLLNELPDTTAVEVPVLIKEKQILPIETGPLPDYAAPLIQTMAEYYRLILDGAEQRSIKALYQALLIHPLFPDSDVSERVIEDLMAINRAFLPDEFS